MPKRLNLLILGLLFMSGAAIPSRAEIARIDLNGAIDPITAQFVISRLEKAASAQSNPPSFSLHSDVTGQSASVESQYVSPVQLKKILC